MQTCTYYLCCNLLCIASLFITSTPSLCVPSLTILNASCLLINRQSSQLSFAVCLLYEWCVHPHSSPQPPAQLNLNLLVEPKANSVIARASAICLQSPDRVHVSTCEERHATREEIWRRRVRAGLFQGMLWESECKNNCMRRILESTSGNDESRRCCLGHDWQRVVQEVSCLKHELTHAHE